MERLQKRAPDAHFVKVFSCVGSAFMVNPKFPGGPPTMFICGNDPGAKAEVRKILDQFGWDTADMGSVEAARAIEPLCMLWCIPGSDPKPLDACVQATAARVGRSSLRGELISLARVVAYDVGRSGRSGVPRSPARRATCHVGNAYYDDMGFTSLDGPRRCCGCGAGRLFVGSSRLCRGGDGGRSTEDVVAFGVSRSSGLRACTREAPRARSARRRRGARGDGGRSSRADNGGCARPPRSGRHRRSPLGADGCHSQLRSGVRGACAGRCTRAATIGRGRSLRNGGIAEFDVRDRNGLVVSARVQRVCAASGKLGRRPVWRFAVGSGSNDSVAERARVDPSGPAGRGSHRKRLRRSRTVPGPSTLAPRVSASLERVPTLSPVQHCGSEPWLLGTDRHGLHP